jgi:fructose-1-phosphate kinase PfkB-like protein
MLLHSPFCCAALWHGYGARPFLLKPNPAEASELTGLPITSAEQALAGPLRCRVSRRS